MHLKVLSKNALALLPKLSPLVKQHSFVLAGGTAMALQVGHRKSDDFDFFGECDFNPALLLSELGKISKVTVLLHDSHSLVVSLNKVKLSFFRYWDNFLFPSVSFPHFDLAHLQDITLMKLIALSQRGSRKDFIDLYFLLRSVLSFDEAMKLMTKKLPTINYNTHHIIKSLNYFSDAEAEPMPKMLVPFRWKEAKKYFNRLFLEVIA